MAKKYLTPAMKKARKGAIAISISCVLVVCAIAYVVYASISQESTFIKDKTLASALSEVFDKSTRSVSKDDVSKIEYFEIAQNNQTGATTLLCGFSDLIALIKSDAEDKNFDDVLHQVELSSDITTYADLTLFTGLKQLSLSSAKNFDTSVLNGLTNLEELSLNNNQISDISFISGLTNLTSLSLSGNKIADISAISNLSKIESLVISQNEITDVSPVSTLLSLKNLYMSNNKVTDISPVGKLTNLESLAIDYNEITDISSLNTLSNLKSFSSESNKIEDASVISNLTNLEQISLASSGISDISPVANLSKLTMLIMNGNKISDITPILGLKELTTAYFNDNAITDVSALTTLNKEKLTTLSLTGNAITDITPLDYLGENVKFEIKEEPTTPPDETDVDPVTSDTLPEGYEVDEDGNITLSGDALQQFIDENGMEGVSASDEETKNVPEKNDAQ